MSLSVSTRDVFGPGVYEELAGLAASRGTSLKAIPVMDAAGTLLQGEEEITGRLERVLATAAGSGPGVPEPGTPAPAPTAAEPSALEGFSALPVLAGGLLDGINPCAFTTLIFLLASLALAGRGRREVLIIGALFTAAVFLTYLGIGLGLFAALRAASSFTVVSVILRWVLVAALLVFAGLSVYDFFVIRSGRPTEILLQLPTVLKRRIHATIRTRVRSAALAGSSLILGFLVSIFEFACTGQVYLPTLAYLVRMRREPAALSLLVLYNLGFIVPLLAVFAASYLGVGSKRITTFFQKNMAAVKIGLAAFFLGLAAFTLLG
jgi:cytochrome c biogenesis protein CcdA